MGTLTIDKKKFVVIEQKEFDKLQLLAAQKVAPSKKLSLAAGKTHAYKLILINGQKESKHPLTRCNCCSRNSLIY